MKPGTFIMIGTFAIAMGLMPPVGVLCSVSGLACLLYGFYGLNQEVKEEQMEPEDKE